MLQGVRYTTHWSAFHLLKCFGAIPTKARVVKDGRHIGAAGVTAGIDAALGLAQILRGEHAAQVIELSIEYAPDPPFHSGHPDLADPDVVEAARTQLRSITGMRLKTAVRVAARLGVHCGMTSST